MRKLALVFSLAAIAIGSQSAVALADDVPTFDVRATCHAEAIGDPSAGTAATCVADEQKARETLAAQWAQFAPQSRTNCVQEQFGATRSYVELLTCLQIAKEVKDPPKE